ncbi:unnamed protein product [Ascophyllum nodosum]
MNISITSTYAFLPSLPIAFSPSMSGSFLFLRRCRDLIRQLQNEIDQQRHSFQLVFRNDRDLYEARTEAAEALAELRAEKLGNLMAWVEKADSNYTNALAKVSAQAEEIGAANLGDLMGFTLSMSKEVEQLREMVAEAIQPRLTRGTSLVADATKRHLPRRPKKPKKTSSTLSCKSIETVKSEAVEDG